MWQAVIFQRRNLQRGEKPQLGKNILSFCILVSWNVLELGFVRFKANQTGGKLQWPSSSHIIPTPLKKYIYNLVDIHQ